MVMGFQPNLGDAWADYLGVPYPMGLVGDDAALAFDASAVSEVVFLGHWDDEAEEGLAAVRRFREAADDLHQQLLDLIESLTPERVEELRWQYAFDALGDEPEPDFPGDEG